MWFQKIFIPPPRREFDIFGGWGGGGSHPQEIVERMGVVCDITFPDGSVRRSKDVVKRISLLPYFADVLYRKNCSLGI